MHIEHIAGEVGWLFGVKLSPNKVPPVGGPFEFVFALTLHTEPTSSSTSPSIPPPSHPSHSTSQASHDQERHHVYSLCRHGPRGGDAARRRRWNRLQVPEERADYEHVGIAAFIEVERRKPAGLKNSGISIGEEKVSEVIVMPPVDIMYHT